MLRLLTFGNLAVHGPQGPLAGALAQPRRLAVLVLVARARERGATRARVVSLLWPDADDAQGKKVVAQALYALRRDLGADDAIVGTHDLRLNADVVWCDVGEFHDAIERGDLAHAVSVYAGPFLDGFRLSGAPEFERWADDERLAIEHRYHEALERLAHAATERSAHDEAARWWRRRAAAEPLNARVAAACMKSLAASGDRGGALAHARMFEALLAEELSLPADREVLELADALRREGAPAPISAAPFPAAAASSIPSAAPDEPRVVAILPFAPLGSHEHAPMVNTWCTGLAEEVITAMLGVASLRVVARGPSFALGPNPGLAPLVTLGAHLAVEGSVRHTGDAWRVTTRLLDTATGRIVWCERSDHSGTDHVAHEQIAARVARAASTLG